MLKINTLNKHKKQAQHVLELALVMPMMMIVFSVLFQMMCESYSNYKFSYVFANAVNDVLKEQEVFESKAKLNEYSFETQKAISLSNNYPKENIGDLIFLDKLQTRLMNSLPQNAGVETSLITSDNVLYVTCSFNVTTKSIIGTIGGRSFLFTIPINRMYIEPVILNSTDDDLKRYFNEFYLRAETDSLPADGKNDSKNDGEDNDGTDIEIVP